MRQLGWHGAVSWDLFIQDLPKGINSIAEIPHDFVREPLGRRDELIARIKQLIPGAGLLRSVWGVINGPGYSVEVNIGEAEEVDSIALHVRGGDLVVGLIADLLDELKVGALDPQSDTGLFQRDEALGSLTRWRAYRDQVVGH
jgi:hypothetical protein